MTKSEYDYKVLYVSPALHQNIESVKRRGQTFERALIDHLDPKLVPDELK